MPIFLPLSPIRIRAVAKENTELLEKINQALAELTADGSIDAIVNKYIPA